MIQDTVDASPVGHIFSISISIKRTKIQCYIQQTKENPKEEMTYGEFFDLFSADKTIRCQTTEIVFDFESRDMHLFKENIPLVCHLWDGQHLSIVIYPCVEKKDIAYFQRMFLFESGLIQSTSSLLVKDYTDCFPYLNPFDHVDLRECKKLSIYAPDAKFDSLEIVDFLHDYEKSTSKNTTEKELCFAFREDNEQYDVVYALIRLLIQRFISDGRRRTYTLCLLNCYGDLEIGYGCGGANTLHSNALTHERLQSQRGIFLEERQQMDLPVKPENTSFFDIKIIRAPKPASMVVKVEK